MIFPKVINFKISIPLLGTLVDLSNNTKQSAGNYAAIKQAFYKWFVFIKGAIDYNIEVLRTCVAFSRTPLRYYLLLTESQTWNIFCCYLLQRLPIIVLKTDAFSISAIRCILDTVLLADKVNFLYFCVILL